MNYEIHERFQQARKAKGLSKAKVADAIGLSRGVIDNIELKRVEEIKELYIDLFCKTLGVNKHWLLKGGDRPMFIDQKSDELGEMFSILTNSEDEILKEVAVNLQHLSEEDLIAIHRIVMSLKQQKKQRS